MQLISQQGHIHDNAVADGWAGVVMRKTLAIQKCHLCTDRLVTGIENAISTALNGALRHCMTPNPDIKLRNLIYVCFSP